MTGEERSKRSSAFPKTRWTVVLKAGEGSDEALETLYRAYQRPIHRFIQFYVQGALEAEDLTQGFFTHEIVPSDKRRLFLGVDRERSFRSWLLGAVTHYIHNEQQKCRTLKRNLGVSPSSLDQDDSEERGAHPLFERAIGHWRTPEELYHRSWAHEVLCRVLDRLGREQSTDRSRERFGVLRPYLVGPDGENPIYAPVAAALDKTVRSIAVDVCELRRRYGELLTQEIADTVARPQDVDEERRFLLAALTPRPECSTIWTQRDAD